MGRQPAADLGGRTSIGGQEEDRRPIAVEQNHGVVHETGEDPVEVEPAPDVPGHPPESVRPMEAMGDLVDTLRGLDDEPGRGGKLDEEVRVDRGLVSVGVGGMGRNNVIATCSQNIVALCDVDWGFAGKGFDPQRLETEIKTAQQNLDKVTADTRAQYDRLTAEVQELRAVNDRSRVTFADIGGREKTIPLASVC